MASFPVNTSLINAPAANVVLTSNMSGTTFICTPGGAARTVTLPSPLIPGLQFWFRHAATVANTITIIGGAGLLKGYYENAAGGLTACGTTSVTFRATAVYGDSIEMISDGTFWYAIAGTSAAAGLSTA